MKTRPMSPLLPIVTAGLLVLSAGCEDETKKAAAADQTAPALPANAPAPTNASADSLQAVPKIVTAPRLAPGVDEIVQLAQAGVGDEVLLAYIENSSAAYKLDVNQVLYLHDLGLSAEVIAAMVRRGQALQEESPPVVSTAPASTTTNETLKPVEESAAAPAPTVATDSTTEYIDSTTSADATAPPQPVTYNYFYTALSPYGTWLEIPDYGWCWQPTVAVLNTGWQPYRDRGRWLNTDYGWYWQSDYSWGWAPFHYGRWYRSPACGWVWAPDTTWGPAWVTWRYSSAYCGWAPLPPGCYYDAGFGFRYRGAHVGLSFDFGLGYDCFTFVPTRYVCHRTPWYHCLPSTGIRAVIHNTTIVNNYTSGSGNNTIVNVGPGTATIAAASRQEIRKVALRDINATDGTLIKADRLDRDGATLAVFRPKLPQQAPTPPPEITQRQQEVRKKSELLARSDVVRLGSGNSDKKTLIAPQRRGNGAVISPGTSPSVPRPVGSVSNRRSPGSESPKTSSTELPRRIGETPARSSSPALSGTDTSVGAKNPNSRGLSDTVLVKPFEQPRRVAPVTGAQSGSIEPRTPSRNEQPSAAHQQPNSLFRSEPVRRQPTQSPQPNFSSPSVSRPAPSYGQPDSGPRPANPPSYRSETRRQESPAPSFTPAPNRAPAPNQPKPTVIQSQPAAPRYNPPAYQPPQSAAPPAFRSEPVRVQPAQPSRPQPAPSFTPAPAPSRPSPSASAPSAPSRPQPAPSSGPSRSEGNRKER